jgi:hypothetical protein
VTPIRPAGRTELKKTTDYYTALYASNLINEWFVEPADYVKLRELSVRYRCRVAASIVSRESVSTG